jgi:hypothetical protein
MITAPPRLQASVASYAFALLSVRDCVKPKSDRAALSSEQAQDWQAAMQHEYASLMVNGRWEVDDLLPRPRGRQQHVDL